MTENQKPVRKHLYISGRVQGVGFRAYTRRKASQEGVTGWVRNLADGRVEVVLSGARENVGLVINSLRSGPSLARVEDIKIEDEEYQGDFTHFSVKY